MEQARVAFAGTPDFAVPSLQALIDAGYRVPWVLTQPDRRAGRGRQLAPSPVKQLAVDHGIPVLQPTVLDATLRSALDPVRPALLVVAAYGLILPRWLLDWPAVDCINVHASLLPRWRGAAPIQQAILAGDATTGISIMRMEAGLDTGPVYRRSATPIGAAETGGELHDRLAAIGALLLIESLPAILAGAAEPEPQDQAAATYAPKIDKRDGRIDWRRSAAELERQVRAFNPWPVAETRTVSGERLRVWRALATAGEASAEPGTVVSPGRDTIEVVTGDGLLRLVEVQAPGGRVMSAAAYLAAHDLRGETFAGPT